MWGEKTVAGGGGGIPSPCQAPVTPDVAVVDMAKLLDRTRHKVHVILKG